jgi:hypothetical protein
VFEPRPGRVREVRRQVADDDLIGGGATQLACQAIIVEPHTRVRLPPCTCQSRWADGSAEGSSLCGSPG